MRTPLIAGNWKMHKTAAEAVDLVRTLVPLVDAVEGVEVAVAPPFTALQGVGRLLRAGAAVLLAAQNVHEEDHGAFTGEVSVPMLQDLGVSMVILGHSERRQLFGETDQAVGRKAARVLAANLVPVLCVGESLAQREAGEAFAVVERQLRAALQPIDAGALALVVIAYEPVWAIGTGRTASKEQAQEMHAHIRGLLADIGGRKQADQVRILYGGSVNPTNIAELMAQPDVDGALVGGASLDAETFASIVRFRV
ncbi:MAG TPA: triose-phosphate isomerase [Deferrisomatales bacterium]|nr:triose-phosphate isomerase [Deferrisomatales bacterium]